MGNKKVKDLAGLAFVGFLFIGLATGAATGRYDIGALAGLGLGFLASLAVKLKLS